MPVVTLTSPIYPKSGDHVTGDYAVAFWHDGVTRDPESGILHPGIGIIVGRGSKEEPDKVLLPDPVSGDVRAERFGFRKVDPSGYTYEEFALLHGDEPLPPEWEALDLTWHRRLWPVDNVRVGPLKMHLPEWGPAASAGICYGRNIHFKDVIVTSDGANSAIGCIGSDHIIFENCWSPGGIQISTSSNVTVIGGGGYQVTCEEGCRNVRVYGGDWKLPFVLDNRPWTEGDTKTCLNCKYEKDMPQETNHVDSLMSELGSAIKDRLAAVEVLTEASEKDRATAGLLTAKIDALTQLLQAIGRQGDDSVKGTGSL
jgi:hypothetical protein